MSSPKPTRQQEAAAWFAAQRAGVMLVEQREAFDAWRADPRNQAALDAMHELWGELAVLKMRGPVPRRAAPAWRPFAVAAAALVVLFGASIAWMTLAHDPGIQTIAGQQKSQSLPDGSLVTVNVASDLSYAMRDDVRLVRLSEGEAAFAVKADRTRPFVVRTGDFEVRAVGTAFNVRQRAGMIEVAVSEGAVEICSASGPNAGALLATLNAGQRLAFPAKQASEDFPAIPEAVPLAQISEWRMRVVTYENATVREVIEDLNRYFDRKLSIGPGSLADRRVTIRLQVQDREQAIGTLADLLGVAVVHSSNGDVLKQPI